MDLAAHQLGKARLERRTRQGKARKARKGSRGRQARKAGKEGRRGRQGRRQGGRAHLAAHQFDELLADREAEPRAKRILDALIANLREEPAPHIGARTLGQQRSELAGRERVVAGSSRTVGRPSRRTVPPRSLPTLGLELLVSRDDLLMSASARHGSEPHSGSTPALALPIAPARRRDPDEPAARRKEPLRG